MNETITPTYEEGVRRGATEQHAIDEQTRLADVFARDSSHARSMRDMALSIRSGLAHVGSCDAEYDAMRLVRELVPALDRLVDHFDTVSTEARDKARTLGEERSS
jgi:hypothetical protein